MNKIFTFLFLIGFCLSCSTDITPVTIVDIKEDLSIQLLQDLGRDNSYIWEITTNQMQDCKLSELVCNVLQTDNHINIELEGITQPENCEGPAGFISVMRTFDLRNPEMSFSFDIRNSVMNEGILIDNGNEIEIEFIDAEGMTLPFRTLRKIQTNFMWLGISTIKTEQIQGFYALKTQLTNYTASMLIPNGNYGYFYYDNGIQLPLGNDDSNYEHAFLIPLNADIDENHPAVSLLKSFLEQYPEITYELKFGNNFKL